MKRHLRPVLDFLFYVAIASIVAAPCVAMLLFLPPLACIAIIVVVLFAPLFIGRWERRRAWKHKATKGAARIYEHG